MREFTVKTLSLVAYVVDIIILAIGVILTAGAAVLFYFVQRMTKVTNDEVYPIVVVIIAIGVILILTSILGICGVCRKTSALLSGFIAAMILILLAQFAAVVICFTFEASAHYFLFSGMHHTLAFYGKSGDLTTFTESIDFMQTNLKCCGLNGPSDFSDYYNATFWVNNGNETNVPDSCCLKAVKKADCGKDMSMKPDSKVIYTKGCYKEALTFLETYLTIFGTGALVFMLVQLANIFVNIMLQRRFKEHEDYQLTSTKLKQVKKIDAEQAAQKKQAQLAEEGV